MKIKCLFLFNALLFFLVLVCSLFLNRKLDSAVVSANYKIPTTVILDAGHGGFDGGAVAKDGTLEKDINLSITMRLKDLFLLGGYNVVMIREQDMGLDTNSDESIGKRKISDMKKRLEIVNSNQDSIFISIHQNKFDSDIVRGAQVFHSPNECGSDLLADCIQKSFASRLQKDNNRIVKKADKNIYLLYNANIPSVIVECGFLSNTKELALLKNDEYQKKVSFTIYCGFLEYLKKDEVLK
jgi:N-acetylmuramoyl-L-alanine amidase